MKYDSLYGPSLSGVAPPRLREPPPEMRATYTLHYEEDALGVEKRVEFEARTPAFALEIARSEAEGRQALLLENGRPLCRLVKALSGDASYWIVAQRPTPD